MATLLAAGCDQFLVFGGQLVYDTQNFGTSSLVDTRVLHRLAAAVIEARPVELHGGRAGPAARDAHRRRSVHSGWSVQRWRSRAEQSVTELQITGRAGIPVRSGAVALNITVTNPRSRLRHGVSVRRSAAQRSTADAWRADHGVDVGHRQADHREPSASSPCRHRPDRRRQRFFRMAPASRPPRRHACSRRASVMGCSCRRQDNGIGPRTAGSVTSLQVGGRVDVPSDAVRWCWTSPSPVPMGRLVTVFPCGGVIPTAATLNYTKGATVTTPSSSVPAQGHGVLYTMAQVD